LSDEQEASSEFHRHRPKEPSIPEVAAQIADHLGVTENTSRTRIKQIVWEFGRTQAQALCTEVLEHVAPEQQMLADRFFALVETKGIKKERPWHIPQREERAVREAALLIAEQLSERETMPRQFILRSIRVLGVKTALALLQETHETEAAGGLMLPDGSRRRTPGGVYFWLVRQRASADQRRQIFQMTAGSRPTGAPFSSRPEQPAKKEEPVRPQPVAVLIWAEREAVLDEAESERGAAKTVKMTIIGRPGKVVEHGTCVVLSMQQAAKIPALPAGLPLPSIDEVEATHYNVYIAAKQWRRVAEAIKDEEDVLIIEGFPVLDAKRATIAVFASNTTTKKLQMAAKQPKV
jgi:hypothetical protein